MGAVRVETLLVLAQESVEAAMRNVMQAIHRIGTGVSQIQLRIPTDWFHQRRKELAPMATPAGTSTTPAGSVINLLNGTLGTGLSRFLFCMLWNVSVMCN